MASYANATSSDLIQYVNRGLQKALADTRDPWRLPVLITLNEGRIVVLRDFDSKTGCWYFYTDRRTPKVSELAENGSKAAAIFYHPGDRSQLRVKGSARRVNEKQRLAFWDELSLGQKSSYAVTLTPGTAILTADDGLSTTWKEGCPSAQEEKTAFENFDAYAFEIEQTELLLLQRGGHLRCKWDGVTGNNFQWLVP